MPPQWDQHHEEGYHIAHKRVYLDKLLVKGKSGGIFRQWARGVLRCKRFQIKPQNTGSMQVTG